MFFSFYEKISSQPHQPFFASGILSLILFIFLIFINYAGLFFIDNSVDYYHGFSMVFVVFIQFFLGFLFTVFPRFLMSDAINQKIYMRHFLGYFILSLLWFVSMFFVGEFHVFIMIALFVLYIFSFRLLLNIHKKSKVINKSDTKWILVSFSFGILALFLYILSTLDFEFSYWLSKLAIDMGFYLFLFGIVFSVSQRMVPFFTQAKISGYVINKSKNFMEILFFLLIIKVAILFFENTKINFMIDIPLFILFVREFYKWRLPIFKSPAILWVLHIGLYWIVVSFFLSSLESIISIFASSSFAFEKAPFHAIAIGYFVTMLLGFGTRVTLAHGGAKPEAGILAISVFALVQVVTLFRVLGGVFVNFPEFYLLFLDLSAWFLMVGLLLWAYKYMPVLLRVR